MGVQFESLPFCERPDLTPYLIHLTRGTEAENGHTALDNLISILETGELRGSDPSKAFIKGRRPAACFMDIPFGALKYLWLKRDNAKYEPYGVAVLKPRAYEHGARPVLYLSNEELDRLSIREHDDELWRVVRLEKDGDYWTSWLHEREWRCPDRFTLPPDPIVLVNTAQDVEELQAALAKRANAKCHPRAILPLHVICQGLAA
jgi:hypothetical protein